MHRPIFLKEKDVFTLCCYSITDFQTALSLKIEILQADKNRETIILLFQVSLLHLYSRSQNISSLFECMHGTQYLSYKSRIFCHRFSIVLIKENENKRYINNLPYFQKKKKSAKRKELGCLSKQSSNIPYKTVGLNCSLMPCEIQFF